MFANAGSKTYHFPEGPLPQLLHVVEVVHVYLVEALRPVIYVGDVPDEEGILGCQKRWVHVARSVHSDEIQFREVLMCYPVEICKYAEQGATKGPWSVGFSLLNSRNVSVILLSCVPPDGPVGVFALEDCKRVVENLAEEHLLHLHEKIGAQETLVFPCLLPNKKHERRSSDWRGISLDSGVPVSAAKCDEMPRKGPTRRVFNKHLLAFRKR